MKAELVKPRGGIGNVLAKLAAGEPVKIAYLGGSITAANGWRVKSREWFAKQYPQAKVEEIHAAIGGTGSDLGVFRVERDALQHKPDLLFVEFAVNDGSAKPDQIWRWMEGIVCAKHGQPILGPISALSTLIASVTRKNSAKAVARALHRRWNCLPIITASHP